MSIALVKGLLLRLIRVLLLRIGVIVDGGAVEGYADMALDGAGVLGAIGSVAVRHSDGRQT
jgi:hypothetical protein